MTSLATARMVRGSFRGYNCCLALVTTTRLGVMTSSAEDCWRLSGDCSRWAVESRDAGSAFRQMATAWAQLAFSEEFSFPVADEHINQNSEPVPAEKAASSPAAAPITVNEKGVDDSNPAADVDVGNCDHTTRADKHPMYRGSTNRYPCGRAYLSLSGSSASRFLGKS